MFLGAGGQSRSSPGEGRISRTGLSVLLGLNTLRGAHLSRPIRQPGALFGIRGKYPLNLQLLLSCTDSVEAMDIFFLGGRD